MSKLTTRIITRNDYDVNWKSNNGLPLLPGELAISIPTREFVEGTDEETDIVIAANGTSPARVVDKDKDMIIKIGDGSSFYNSDNIITGTAGVLTQFAPYGTEAKSQENIIELAKNAEGVTEISIRQARKEVIDEVTEYKSGIMSSEDYKNYTTIAEFFGASPGGALTISEETIKGAIAGAVTDTKIKHDNSLEINDEGELGVSENIFWVCGDSSSDTNNAAV